MRSWKRYAIIAALVAAYTGYAWFAGSFGVHRPRHFEGPPYLVTIAHDERLVFETRRITEYLTPWPWRFLFGKTFSYRVTGETWALDAATLRVLWHTPLSGTTKIASLGNADGLVWVRADNSLHALSLETGAVVSSSDRQDVALIPEAAAPTFLLGAQEVTAFGHWYALLSTPEAADMAEWLDSAPNVGRRPFFYDAQRNAGRRFYRATLAKGTDEYPLYNPANYGPLEESTAAGTFIGGEIIRPAKASARTAITFANPDSVLVRSSSSPTDPIDDRLTRMDSEGQVVWTIESQLEHGFVVANAYWPRDALIVTGQLEPEAYTAEEAAANPLRSVITRIDLKTGILITIRDDQLPD